MGQGVRRKNGRRRNRNEGGGEKEQGGVK
jgi:hypothetical protein